MADKDAKNSKQQDKQERLGEQDALERSAPGEKVIYKE
jgi:hypothetical protein